MVSKISTDHRDLHGSVSKVGKAVDRVSIFDMRHEKTEFKVFVVVIPQEGWARVAAPILLLA